MFGIGPIRAADRDIQAIRHQNFVAIYEKAKAQYSGITRLLNALGISRKKIEEHITNPFLRIPQRIVRKYEKYANKSMGWMDEQHVESDPVCSAFPDDMRHVMQIYSNLPSDKRKMFLQIAEIFNSEA